MKRMNPAASITSPSIFQRWLRTAKIRRQTLGYLTAISFLALTQSGHAQTSTWTDGAGFFGFNQWTNKNNWSPTGVPTSSSQVIIDLAGGQAADVSGTAVAGTLVVGNSATGSLVVGGGLSSGTLTVGSTVTLGQNLGSNGTITVSGLGAAGTLTAGGQITIGGSGSGTLLVTSLISAAKVNANGGLVLDAASGQTGTLTVTGPQSTLNVAGGSGLIVGNDDSGTNGTNTATITLGGTATISAGSVIVGNGGAGTNSLTVSVGSTLTQTAGDLIVGNAGSGTNTVTVALATLNQESGNIIVGNEGTGTNTLTVSGLSTVTEDTGNLIVGDTATGTNTLNVEGVSTLNASTAGQAIIGDAAGSAGTANVTGASTLDTSSLNVGHYGTGTLNVNTLSTVNTSGAQIGDREGGTGTVTIDTGGSFLATGTVSIGDFGGTGTVNVGTTSTSTATFTADNLHVGDGGTGTFNGEGTHSVSTVSGDLTVGEYPSGNGQVNLSDEAQMSVTTGNVTVGSIRGTGAITLTSGATLTAQSTTATTGTFTIGDSTHSTGTVTVGETNSDTATLKTDTLVVGNLGTGTLSVQGTGAVVTVGTGNISVGENVDHYNDGGVDTYSDQAHPETGTITVTNGGTLNATTNALTGVTSIGTAGTGIVNIGAGGMDTATMEVDSLVVGGSGTGTLNISGTGAVVSVGSGNVTLGTGITDPVDGTDGLPRYGLGTINITQGGTLDASTVGGTFIVGNNGAPAYGSSNQNVVNVGLNAGDTATLETATLEVGPTSTGVVNVDGLASSLTVNTGNLTLGSGDGGKGLVYITNGGTVTATTLAGTGVTDVSNGFIILGTDSNYNPAGTGTLLADSLVVGDAGLGSLDAENGSTVTISNGVIVGGAGGGLGSVTVTNAGSTFTVTTGDMNVGTNAGSGLFEVNDHAVATIGNGNLNVGATGEVAALNGGTIKVTGGAVNVASHGVFVGGGDSELTVNNGTGNFNNAGTLYINNSDPTPALGLTHFTLNSNYVGQGGTLQFSSVLNSKSPADTGELTVTGNTSGDSLVHVTNVGGSGGPTNGQGIQLMDVEGTNNGTYQLDSRVMAGAYDYTLNSIVSGPDAGLYLTSHVSPEVVGAASIATSGQYLELASLDSMVQREGELVQSYQTDVSGAEMKDGKTVVDQPTSVSTYDTSEVWSRGIYRYDNVHTSFGLTQNTGVGQIGGDYQFRSVLTANDRLYVGGLADYGQSSASTGVQNVHVDGEAVDFGGYMTYVTGGFYANAVLEGDLNHFKVQGPYGDFGASGSGLSTAFETGYAFNVGGGVHVEPQVGLVYEYESYNTPSDQVGRTYNLNDPDFLQGRIGVRIDKSFLYAPGLHLTPYIRVNGMEQFLGDNQTTVSGATFTENVGGASIAVDGGLTIDVTKNVSLYATGNSAWGERDDSYGASAGVKVSW